MPADASTLSWVVLTRGDRPQQLQAAIASIRRQSEPSTIVLVVNGDTGTEPDLAGDVTVRLSENVGVPGGRDRGVRATSADIVAFLDDDAELVGIDVNQRVVEAFHDDPRLGALAARIVDEGGRTDRRHVPRLSSQGERVPGQVVNFLGGACAIRRSAYEDAGGYWSELWYAHEELDLAWRLAEAGYTVGYLPDIEVFHPRTSISRHADGWRYTGRNRVMIARRDLPWPVALLHVAIWALLGTWRAPGRTCKRAYLVGWWAGWRTSVERQPISWPTVARLAKLGRPPIV